METRTIAKDHHFEKKKISRSTTKVENNKKWTRKRDTYKKTEKGDENSPLDVGPGSEVSLELSEIDGHGDGLVWEG